MALLPLRRSAKEIRDPQVVEALLQAAPVGRLGTVGADGSPRIKPLNFAWHRGRVYVHSAREGEKIEDIRRDPRVCFEVDQPLAYVKARTQPCRATYLYRSVVLLGRAALVEDPAERREGLDALLAKYQPGEVLPPYPPEKLVVTAVLRIDPQVVVGKEDLGSGAVRDRILQALERGARLPLVFEEG
ncbi:MAG: pyridoxamine 5'-phosphate oxidase family protein [Deferrisomatales bacterium]|nr:pyridoxamine 5'-phosphate oxidase family protein [Deferrisomatales bacterium]